MKPTKDAAQKQKEFNWLRTFQEKCLACPRSIPDQPEPPAPDILFAESSLGIEITEYLLGQGKEGSRSRRVENVRQRVVREAQSEYESSSNRCLQVSVSWAREDCPPKRDEKCVSQALVQLVALCMSQSHRLWRIGWEQLGDPILQRYLAEVKILLVGEQGQSCWSSEAALFVWEVEPRVQAALDHKESKVTQYRRFCGEIWLLMVADDSSLSSTFFPNETFRQGVFNSSFNRAFLLDVTKPEVHEFKLVQHETQTRLRESAIER